MALCTAESPRSTKDAGTSLEDGDEPAGSGDTAFTAARGYELISDIVMNGKDVFEPLFKVRAVLLTRIFTD